MLFHTWPFLIFFAVVFTFYWSLRRTSFWLPWLLIASYVFYGFWDPRYLLLIVYSTALDYVCVEMMARGNRRKLWLWLSIINNLGLLAYFKYTNFFIGNANWLADEIGIAYQIPFPDIVLPVGISFFTFQSMSYTIDFYRGNIDREPSFVRFATFVAFFPQLVAGPVERAKKLLPQLVSPARFSWTNVSDGCSLFLTGLFKKVALSNYLAAYADPIFNVPERYSGAHLAMATFAFAWQIYFDFSGYTDMARGVARSMGFDLMLNFRHPYLATGLGDFWSRWHISLSTWFRDYVYIPLGGSQGGRWKTYRNLFLVMLISGFWHGANWTFIVWGALHGLGATLTWSVERANWYRNSIPEIFKQIAVFLFVCFGWIFFRAEDMLLVNVIITRIFSSAWTNPEFPTLLLFMIMSIWVYQWLSESRFKSVVENGCVKFVLAICMVAYLSVAPGQSDKPFIYFQF